jgi:hypothetical protein
MLMERLILPTSIINNHPVLPVNVQATFEGNLGKWTEGRTPDERWTREHLMCAIRVCVWERASGECECQMPLVGIVPGEFESRRGGDGTELALGRGCGEMPG